MEEEPVEAALLGDDLLLEPVLSGWLVDAAEADLLVLESAFVACVEWPGSCVESDFFVALSVAAGLSAAALEAEDDAAEEDDDWLPLALSRRRERRELRPVALCPEASLPPDAASAPCWAVPDGVFCSS
ncbi:hypothetical protein HCU01_06980 [Halomonas cupida]|uniref:Secreted protein n=1 Tax=Halomonas cupida TaxID=44933 RepID=A0ABQ0WAY9_9GAMM|nr:hypothetical protein [Halomonas cupida]GEN22749.1 hypothetical protein HCU01_06980 [Halomonas cupida]